MDNIQDTQSGRTSSALSPPTREKTSKRSSKHSSGSQNQRQPRCLCLKKGPGPTLTFYWETDGALLTELWTLNIGEHPSVVDESTLSQILEAGVQEKYYLSPKACRGILHRASVRGKELPVILRKALERQAAAMEMENS